MKLAPKILHPVLNPIIHLEPYINYYYGPRPIVTLHVLLTATFQTSMDVLHACNSICMDKEHVYMDSLHLFLHSFNPFSKDFGY